MPLFRNPRFLIPLLLLPCCAAAAEPPRRVVSLNLCSDQLLLELVAPERIASLTWLSRTDGDPALRGLAAQLPSNRGSAEEVLAARPDLVLAGRYTTSTTRALLRRVGVPMLEIDAVQDWEGIRRVTREVAAAVGAEARGEAMIAQMDAQLAATAALRASTPVRAIGWSGAAEDVPGRDTLFDTIVTTAGGLNIAAQPMGGSSFDLERVLRQKPRLLLRGTAQDGDRTVRSWAANHRVLQALPGLSTIEYSEGAWACGVPRAAGHALELARQLRALAEPAQ
jgi:iron complex transport system substrate-binding protein